MTRILFFVLALALLAACAPVPATDPPLSEDWSVTLIKSGGIAGVMLNVTVTSDGAATATDQRADRTATLQLTTEELAALRELVNAAWLANLPSSYPNPTRKDSSCADCFQYDLNLRMGNETFRAQFDDITLFGSGLEPLVNALQVWMDSVLEGQ